MSKLFTGLLSALFVAAIGTAANAAGTTTTVAATGPNIPASFVCRAAAKGETPTATDTHSNPLVCKRVDFRGMVAKMQDMFMMPVGIDWMSLLENRDYDQNSR